MNRNHNVRIKCLLMSFFLMLSLAGCDQLPHLISSVRRDALLINEVVTSNQLSFQDPVYGSPDWIELYNSSDENVHLGSYYITDNVEASQKAFRLPDVDLAPGEYYLIYASNKNGPKNTGFSLKKSGETITLLDTHMEEISSLSVPALIRDVSFARRADGSYGYCDLPTPGEANAGVITDIRPASSQLISELEPEPELQNTYRSPDVWITEVVSKNKTSLSADGCEDCGEWVELYNPNSTSVSLSGFTLTDDALDVQRQNFPEIELMPGQYLIVCCGRKPCTAGEHVRVDLGLSSEGEQLYLFDSNGNLLDQVAFPALLSDTSWSKGPDGNWGFCIHPTPGKGASAAELRENLAPQQVQEPFKTLCINEVLDHNLSSILDEDGDRSGFVELYNGGEDTIRLAGWFLSDNKEKPSKWAFPDISIAPGSYLLVFLSGKDRTGKELHASFSIRDGETLMLYNAFELEYDALLIPETSGNVSVGRDVSGKTVFYSHPTPLEENGYPLTTGK